MQLNPNTNDIEYSYKDILSIFNNKGQLLKNKKTEPKEWNSFGYGTVFTFVKPRKTACSVCRKAKDIYRVRFESKDSYRCICDDCTAAEGL